MGYLPCRSTKYLPPDWIADWEQIQITSHLEVIQSVLEIARNSIRYDTDCENNRQEDT